MEPRVAGDAKQYGCLALDNLYNVMHTTDRERPRIAVDFHVTY
jgi:hypothetical protein